MNRKEALYLHLSNLLKINKQRLKKSNLFIKLCQVFFISGVILTSSQSAYNIFIGFVLAALWETSNGQSLYRIQIDSNFQSYHKLFMSYNS
jgi:hypothetical protein